jgi:glycosyltransferase involved in cell wall biosynthesis
MTYSNSFHYNLPHIIAYTDSRGIGGSEISLGHLIAATSSDWQITVVGVCPEVIQTICSYRPNVKPIILSDSGPMALARHWLTFQRLHPQIIHFNCCTPWANAVGLAAAMLLPRLKAHQTEAHQTQVKLVRVDQLPLRTTDALTLWRTRGLCLRVDAHIAVGQTSARRMEDFYALGRNSVISIPNGVPELANSAESSRRHSADAHLSDLIVGSIGRLDAMKGHDILLRAAAQVERIKVVILGEGAERPVLEQLAQDLQISDRVQFKGWVPNPRDQLGNFDVVVLPSRSEGFPLAMVEAMLAARLVIATRVGSMPEAIIDGKTGYLIEKDDVEALTSALRKLRDQPDLITSLGQNAQTAAQTNWTATAMAKRYDQLWRELLASPNQSRLSVPRPRD